MEGAKLLLSEWKFYSSVGILDELYYMQWFFQKEGDYTMKCANFSK